MTRYMQKKWEKLKQELKGLLNQLPEREAKILRLRFGLENSHSHTLEEVGSVFHVTRERVRQIEARALLKLGWKS